MSSLFDDSFLADLQAQMQGDAAKPIRVEVVLQKVPETGTNDWMTELASFGGLSIDGRTGPLVSGTIAPADVARLAAMPNVATVRSARPTRSCLPSRWPTRSA